MKQQGAETDRSDVIRRVASLPAEKRTLLEQKLKVLGFDSFVKQVISHRATGESSPLSFAQQRLWFLDQYEPNSAVYNVPSALRLRGELNSGALEQSLNEIVRRHEVLRTTFSMVGGEPVQVIAPSLAVSLSVVDLTNCPEQQREEKAQELARDEAHRPFDLTQGPLFRSTLLRLGDEDHILFLTMHHIVSDGWSMGVLHRELSVLYQAFSQGEPSPLPDLPIQYADFAVWQREWLQGKVLEQQLSYWKKQLEGIPAVLNLPTDRPRPAVQGFRGKRQSVELSKELTQGLKALSRKEGVTLYMTLLAAFQTLLYRYTGQEDIVVGSPIANRNRIEIEELIGFFVNTLVLRSDLRGNPTFRELLDRVRKTALEAYDHQDLPFEKLVEELQPQRNLSQNPLFQVMFILQNARREALEFAGLTIGSMRVDTTTSKFDLTLSMHEEAEGLRGSLEYSTDLFNRETVKRMFGHFQTLLEGIVANPDQSICDLPILTEREKHQLLVEWNETQRDYPTDKCIHELFEEQVERTPDAVAVVFEDRQLTYRELNERANRLAHHLRKLGIGPEVLVGICVERSVEMFVGILGILKAGGAYLPLDPEYPKERVRFMLEDAQAPVLITQQRLVKQLPQHQAQLVCLDSDAAAIAFQPSTNLDRLSEPESLAYVIYTSGSTGLPKGILGPHRGILNRFAWMWETYPFVGGEVCCQKTSVNFVDSIWEMFGGLLKGVPTVIIPDTVVKDPLLLVQHLAKHKVTRIVVVSSLLGLLLDSNESLQERLPLLRFWITSGEALTQAQAHSFSEHMPETTLVNLYGSSEVSADVTRWELNRNGFNVSCVPIGCPIANLKVYIFDAHLQPVPVGVPGELYIGGEGLARGYLNRADLTAQRFIPNPFGTEQGARLYRTGDLTRYLPNGNIEFLGRVDDQVKIRGYRIELGEIESVLGQHPSVREVVVLAREDSPGDKRLVAYIVFSKAQACTGSELRSFLIEKLPEYMVPSAFVVLDSLPLTPNGKIDRKALPLPDQSRAELKESYVLPRNPVEEIIVEIWAEVLKREQIGIHDNFFELGGHSLLATQVISRLREAFRLDLRLRALFEAPTVAALALKIEQGKPGNGEVHELACSLAEVEALSEEETERELMEDHT